MSDGKSERAVVFRRALEDFEGAVADFLEDPALNEVKLTRCRKAVLKLYAEINSETT